MLWVWPKKVWLVTVLSWIYWLKLVELELVSTAGGQGWSHLEIHRSAAVGKVVSLSSLLCQSKSDFIANHNFKVGCLSVAYSKHAKYAYYALKF